MARTKWDQSGERLYETGLDRGVLYPKGTSGYEKGVAWNGLTSIDESPSGAEANDIYADNIKYLSLRSAENFGYTINAYTYPDEFAPCDGQAIVGNGLVVSQQTRKPFGLCYRSLKGNDLLGDDYGYLLHIVYNSTVNPSSKTRSTTNESPEAVEMSWEATTITEVLQSIDPTTRKAYKPTAHLVIDSTKCTTDAQKKKLTELEDLLYGTDAVEEHYEATVPTTTNPATEGLYERSGNTYVATEDTTVTEGKTYYKKIEAHEATDPSLPSPDEVIALLSSVG